MNRTARHTIIVFTTALLLTPLAGLHADDAARTKPADKRPNIVFCFADDWGRYASIYANVETRPSINQVIKTPVIDRMAREGVLFKNAFVTAPSCTPCRSSLLSGQYFFRTGRGAILQGAVWDSSIPSYPLLLRDAGYHIGKTYKVWSPGAPADAPYGGQNYAYEKAGSDFRIRYDKHVLEMVRGGMTVEAAKQKILGQVRGNFDAFLADRKPGQPFCYWFGPSLTHRPFVKGSGKALWGLDPDSVRGKLPKFMPDVPEVRGDYTDYMGQILAWDAGVGVIVEKLRAIGELDNTHPRHQRRSRHARRPRRQMQPLRPRRCRRPHRPRSRHQARPRRGRFRQPHGSRADISRSRRPETSRRDDRPQLHECAARGTIRPG